MTNAEVVSSIAPLADTVPTVIPFILRTNPLLIQIMSSSGATEEEIDDFFRSAVTR